MTNSEIIEHIVSGIAAIRREEEREDWPLNRPFTQGLIALLGRLERKQMVQIIALMYFGRGDFDSFVQGWEHCDRRFLDSTAIAHELLNKAPSLTEYFDRAKKRAKLDGLNMDSPPLPQVEEA